jgi:GTP-binding protein Era
VFRDVYFPEDFYTQQSLRFRISEIIREKVFIMGKEEIPHSSFVQVESMEDTKKIFKIAAYIYVETESQKYILIGKR